MSEEHGDRSVKAQRTRRLRRSALGLMLASFAILVASGAVGGSGWGSGGNPGQIGGPLLPASMAQLAGGVPTSVTPVTDLATVSPSPSLPVQATTAWAGLVYCPGLILPSGGCGQGGSLAGAFGCWTLPQVADTITGTGAPVEELSTWVGLGGTPGSTTLAQAGVTLAPGQAPQAWWETLPSPQTDVSLTLAPGDLVCVQVALLGTNIFGNQLWHFWIQDEATGATWDNDLNPQVCGNPLYPSCAAVNTNSAEWIVETPTLSGTSVATAPAFSAITMTDLWVESGGPRGIWVLASQLLGPGHELVDSLQGQSRTTELAYMTEVLPPTSDDPASTFSVEYLEGFEPDGTVASAPAGDVLPVATTASDRVVGPFASPFTLADVVSACPSGVGACTSATVLDPAVGPGVLDLPLPATGGMATVQACLWWAAPGSSPGALAPGSLLLECLPTISL